MVWYCILYLGKLIISVDNETREGKSEFSIPNLLVDMTVLLLLLNYADGNNSVLNVLHQLMYWITSHRVILVYLVPVSPHITRGGKA